jgi:hypothetical protein
MAYSKVDVLLSSTKAIYDITSTDISDTTFQWTLPFKVGNLTFTYVGANTDIWFTWSTPPETSGDLTVTHQIRRAGTGTGTHVVRVTAYRGDPAFNSKTKIVVSGC